MLTSRVDTHMPLQDKSYRQCTTDTVVHNAIDDLLEYRLVPQGLLTTAQVVNLLPGEHSLKDFLH